MLFDDQLSLQHSFGFIYLEWEDATEKLQIEFHERVANCNATAKPRAELRTVEVDDSRLRTCGLMWNEISNKDRLKLNEFFRTKFEAEQKQREQTKEGCQL